MECFFIGKDFDDDDFSSKDSTMRNPKSPPAYLRYSRRSDSRDAGKSTLRKKSQSNRRINGPDVLSEASADETAGGDS